MKRILGLLVLFALYVGVGVASAQSTYAVQLNWTNTDSSVPVCSATVTKTCVKARTLTDVTVSTAPVVISSAIAPTLTTYTTPALTYTVPITRLYTLVTNYADASGNAQASAAASCGSGNTAAPCSVSIFVVLPPTNLTATPVQTSEVVQPEEIKGMM